MIFQFHSHKRPLKNVLYTKHEKKHDVASHDDGIFLVKLSDVKFQAFSTDGACIYVCYDAEHFERHGDSKKVSAAENHSLREPDSFKF